MDTIKEQVYTKTCVLTLVHYNTVFTTCEQLTNDIEVVISFSIFFAYIINELLTESDMAANDMDVDMNGQEEQNRPNSGQYIPPVGRAGSLVIDLTGRVRGLRHSSPPHVGRGLSAFAIGKGRGLRFSSPPRVGRVLDFPQFGRSEISIPSLLWIFCHSCASGKSKDPTTGVARVWKGKDKQ